MGMGKGRSTITIEREGQFTVGWKHSHNHQCGNVGTGIMNYKVRISSALEYMNDSGWLIDNNDIPAYFRNKYSHISDFLSCEHIAHVACGDLAAIVREGGANPQRISVSVSGIPGSNITCEWFADDEQ